MGIKTTPELNAEIVNRLRMSGNKYSLYAALRIEELEEKEIDGIYNAERIKDFEAEIRRLSTLLNAFSKVVNER